MKNPPSIDYYVISAVALPGAYDFGESATRDVKTKETKKRKKKREKKKKCVH